MKNFTLLTHKKKIKEKPFKKRFIHLTALNLCY